MKRLIRGFALMGSLACLAWAAMPAATAAEVKEVTIARQFGLVHLPLMIMEDKKLIESNSKRLGLPEVKGVFKQLASTGGINDAILAGQLDLAPNGAPSLLTIWDKTRGTPNEVRGVIGVNQFAFFLNVNRPGLKSIRDFGDKDRIALSAVKVSVPAILLQMAAEKEWGPKEYTRLDSKTVSMAHPDGMVALLSKRDITAHFTSPPYMYDELEKPGITKLLSSEDILGGPTIGTLLFATKKFRDANPTVMKAVVAAVTEAVDFINKDRKAAAEVYLRMSKDKTNSVQDIVKQLEDPSMVFTITPLNFMRYADFMHRIGTIKNHPATWKDAFFPEAYDLKGS